MMLGLQLFPRRLSAAAGGSFRRGGSWSGRWSPLPGVSLSALALTRARGRVLTDVRSSCRLFSTSNANVGRRAYQKKHFQDFVKILVRGGNGGLGCNSFNVVSAQKRRPDGGSGGRGGDVIIQCCDSLSGGLNVRKRTFGAQNGFNGTSQQMHGGRGRDVVVKVPRGTVVYSYKLEDEDEGMEGFIEPDEFELIADLDQPNQSVVVARGGQGAEGNAYTRKEERRRFKDQDPHSYGEPGDAALVVLELKTIADVGLVGFPNAGKSTLLGALSKARPKVAPYAFTTVQPMVGHVEFADHFSLTVADIPGLIDGAHENRGLGHEFLRHIQRTKVLCFVIDVAASAREASSATTLTSSSSLPTPKEAVAQYLILDDELRLYDEELAYRPRVVVLNQVDRLCEAYSDVIMTEQDQHAIICSFEDALAAVTDAPVVVTCARDTHGGGVGTVANLLRAHVAKQGGGITK